MSSLLPVNSPEILNESSLGDWSFDYQLYDKVQTRSEAKGGLVLKNMFHDGYSFAKDFRVLGIWFFPTDTINQKPTFLVLGPPNFKINYFKKYNSKQGGSVERAPYNFNAFNTYLQFEIEYESSQGLFGQQTPIKIVQKYLFSDYSDSPTHEPAGAGVGLIYGALIATRFFPMITVKLGEEYEGIIRSFRVDYYIHPKIDGYTIKAKNIRTCSADYPQGLENFPNQAGVFLDGINPVTDTLQIGAEYFKDSMYGFQYAPGGMNVPFILSPLLAPKIKTHDPDFMTAAFKAMEKPLVLEICTTGIKDSTNVFDSANKNYGWDNIHWWGSRGTGNPIISAIGAFHCFHLHWNWNYAAQALLPGAPQFEGINGGPMVDPLLPIQTVQFAIAKYSKSKDPELVDLTLLSKEKFSDLFNSPNSPTPQNINLPNPAGFEGNNIVLWYSIEAQIPEGFKEGTVFIHGIFFAHENEPLYHPFTGSMTEEYKPNSKAQVLQNKQWDR